MRNLISLKYLFVLVLVVFFLSGCGGSSDSVYSPNPNPNPEPDTEPTPEPVVQYDISVISGDWQGTVGSGTAIGPDGTFDLKLLLAKFL